MGLGTHVWRKHGDGIKHDPNVGYKNGTRKRVSWNKGLTKETSDIVAKTGRTRTENLRSGKTISPLLGRKLSAETKAKLSLNSGGYRKGSGRGKSGWYKDIWCDSTWELAWIIYAHEHNIQFTRNSKKFEYSYQGKKRGYIPDFLLEDHYLEIKGYLTEIDTAKFTANLDKSLKILKKEDMLPILDFAKKKCGNDLRLLYEDPKNKGITFKKKERKLNARKLPTNVWESRKNDYESTTKDRHQAMKLSKLWGITSTQVRRFIHSQLENKLG